MSSVTSEVSMLELMNEMNKALNLHVDYNRGNFLATHKALHLFHL